MSELREMFVLGHLKLKFNCMEIDKSIETDISSGNGMTNDELSGSEIHVHKQHKGCYFLCSAYTDKNTIDF